MLATTHLDSGDGQQIATPTDSRTACQTSDFRPHSGHGGGEVYQASFSDNDVVVCSNRSIVALARPFGMMLSNPAGCRFEATATSGVRRRRRARRNDVPAVAARRCLAGRRLVAAVDGGGSSRNEPCLPPHPPPAETLATPRCPEENEAAPRSPRSRPPTRPAARVPSKRSSPGERAAVSWRQLFEVVSATNHERLHRAAAWP